jgi:ABC-type branched-subunit amino acid transport system substrate-binding protein
MAMRARSTNTFAVLSALVAVVLAVGGCGGGAGADDDAISRSARLYGSDGNMSNSFGDELKDQPGVLAGMKGTTPLTPLSEDFKRRLRTVNPNLPDYNYSGETYDAVVIAALAAETARTVDPPSIARQIIGVTSGGTLCESVAACLGHAKAGRDFQFRGISLRRSGLTQAGEPSSAMYGTLNFGPDNKIDQAKTEYVGAGDEKNEFRSPPPAPASTRPGRQVSLRIATLLPKTGPLGLMGPPMFAAAQLAINELNAAGGVLGQQVLYEEADDGTSSQVANLAIDKLIASGTHVIIGAGASGVSKAVLPKAVAAQRVMISPSATSDELTTIDDKGMFFRTSPPDVLQAKALADIIMRDGPRRVVIIARDDTYGTGLQAGVQEDLLVAGIKPADLLALKYSASTTDADPQRAYGSVFVPSAKQIEAFKPDAILVIGFGESALIIKALVAAEVKMRA